MSYITLGIGKSCLTGVFQLALRKFHYLVRKNFILNRLLKCIVLSVVACISAPCLAVEIPFSAVKNVFENRCSACHNTHFQSRNGTYNWNDELLTTQSKEMIHQAVIMTARMPKKWTEKYSKWPKFERDLFRGWLEGRSYAEVGVPEGTIVSPDISWPPMNRDDAVTIFEQRQCDKCLQLLPSIDNTARGVEAANDLYWAVYYLGGPLTEIERNSYLQWTTDDLIRVASWLKTVSATEVSYQWIKVRATLGRQQ